MRTQEMPVYKRMQRCAKSSGLKKPEFEAIMEDAVPAFQALVDQCLETNTNGVLPGLSSVQSLLGEVAVNSPEIDKAMDFRIGLADEKDFRVPSEAGWMKNVDLTAVEWSALFPEDQYRALHLYGLLRELAFWEGVHARGTQDEIQFYLEDQYQTGDVPNNVLGEIKLAQDRVRDFLDNV